ncbi:hypothetical protein BVRB_3g062810 [Beta vulgaris subsp. vulgaris]|nr:hypothetical protein BVRB_3g062810 [Beta vulgaris subsp. vulgaris]
MNLKRNIFVRSGYGSIMGMLVTALLLLGLPQILPPTLPPPPSLLLFLPVIIMVVLLHFALCLSPKVPMIKADYACI